MKNEREAGGKRNRGCIDYTNEYLITVIDRWKLTYR